MSIKSAGQRGTAAINIPEEHWAPIVERVAAGPDHLVIIDDSWNVIVANDAYLAAASSPSFLDEIVPESRAAILEAAARSRLDGARIDVARRARAGTRVVRYEFRRSERGWVVIGSDETDKLELLAQMSCVVEELESSILGERREGLPAVADEDALTGLSGNAGLAQALAAFEKRRVEEGVPYAAVILDLDGFDQLNAVHGHVIGDDVLRRVAAEIAACVRDGDVVARIEGDAFAVLAGGSDLERGLLLAERLRRAVGGARMPRDVIRVEASLGVAAANAGDGPGDMDVLARARVALARAKSSGRNCARAPE